MPEGDLARRVREQASAAVDWSTEARVKAPPRPKPRTENLVDGLPRQPVPLPVGAVGRLVPTPHEAAILRRAGRPGGFILITLREGKSPLYTYEDGSPILNNNRQPLTVQDFSRLQKFLAADHGGSLFRDGPPQRFNVRRLP